MVFHRCLVPILCAACVSGAEGLIYHGNPEESAWLDPSRPYLDIRLGIGMVPALGTRDVAATVAPVSFTMKEEVDEDTATAGSFGVIGGKLAPFGWLFGGELVYAVASQEMTSREISGTPVPLPAGGVSNQYRTFGANAMIGGGWRLNRYLHFEGLGVLGGGWNDLTFLHPTGVGSDDGGGTYWNAGLRTGAYFTYERFCLGLVAEYMYTDLSADAEWADATSSIDESFSGLGVWLQLGVHIQ